MPAKGDRPGGHFCMAHAPWPRTGRIPGLVPVPRRSWSGPGSLRASTRAAQRTGTLTGASSQPAPSGPASGRPPRTPAGWPGTPTLTATRSPTWSAPRSRHRPEAAHDHHSVQPVDGQPGAGRRHADVPAGRHPHRHQAGPHPQARRARRAHPGPMRPAPTGSSELVLSDEVTRRDACDLTAFRNGGLPDFMGPEESGTGSSA